jgi:hypothetical protein
MPETAPPASTKSVHHLGIYGWNSLRRSQPGRPNGPFAPGQISRGQITIPRYEHIKWEATVQKMEPERLFSFTWHPYPIENR